MQMYVDKKQRGFCTVPRDAQNHAASAKQISDISRRHTNNRVCSIFLPLAIFKDFGWLITIAALGYADNWFNLPRKFFLTQRTSANPKNEKPVKHEKKRKGTNVACGFVSFCISILK